MPWDSARFGINAYEITSPTRSALQMAAELPGHYTVRVDPRSSKQYLHEFGFYYCDTLIEPFCPKKQFVPFADENATASNDATLEPLLEICHGAFSHGRFHRDFNLTQSQADIRYDNWLRQLHAAGNVYALQYKNELAGFIALDCNRLVLHALAASMRGQGIAKHLWTPVCRMLFDAGHEEVTSSISSSNLAVLNLYARLGFRFRNPVDIYHRLSS